MKTYLFTFFFMILGFAAYSQSKIEFSTLEVKMGQIPQGVPAEATFVVKNTGDQPLILTNVQASCGCTAPEWPKDPIMPGETAIIKAVYSANAVGVFSKTVTVTSNASTPSVILRISGEVLKKNE
jgi:hypothetical protein